MICGDVGGKLIPAEEGAVTAVKQQQSGREARLCPIKKNANKDSRGFSSLRGAAAAAAAVEVQLKLRKAKVDGGG